ncbi:MAG TPA: phosphate acetyltransferase, partial [Bacteroidetes bacterium]|nr:phosphate acetyltransferase [Bacteroidota bacterium]
ILDEKIAVPILLGNERVIKKKIKNLNLDLKKLKIIDPTNWDRFEDYVQEFYRLRQRRGVTLVEAREFMANKNYFGAMMVHMGDADGLISGITQHYPETIRPALQVIRMRETVKRVSGLYIIITKNEAMFFADTTVNIEPTAEELAEIALCAAEVAKRFDVTPKIAMLSFSNFGSTRHPLAEKVRRATEIVQERAPELMVDGEMQADTAVVPEIIEETYPFSQLKGPANILIFPDLEAGNIAYKLMQRIGGAEAIGPILMGMRKPVHVLQRGAEVNDIVNMTAIAVVDAQELC